MKNLLCRVAIATSLLAGTALVGVLAPANVAQAAGASYVAVDPVRVRDTRPDDLKPQPDSVIDVEIAGQHGVPADASAVWLNVTAVLPEADGHVTVFPCGYTPDTIRPGTSNVNFTKGSVSPNAVLAMVGEGGKVCFWTAAPADLVVDLNGYVPADGSPEPIFPVRAADTRKGTTKPEAGSVTTVQIAGLEGVPDNPTAAMLNVTAVQPEDRGHLTVYPCDETRTDTSNVNYTAGATSPNAVLSGLGADGTVCIWTAAASHIVVDVMGVVPVGATPVPIAPARLEDTRPSTVKVAADSVTEVQVAGEADVPADATAAMLNVTAVMPDGPGHLTVYPCDATRTNTSNVNYTAGSASPNAVMSGLSADGKVCIWTPVATHIVVDVMAYVPTSDALPAIG